MARKTYKYFVDRGLTPPAHLKPKTTGYERRTYNWYVLRGLTPPANLKVPKVIKTAASLKATAEGLHHSTAIPVQPTVSVETEDQIAERISTRFEVLEALIEDVANDEIRSLIISGPPGFSKSFTVEGVLGDSGVEYETVKGHSRATGLFKKLWDNRSEGQIVVFDDCDSVFSDEVSLNLLKSALDTTERRVISWLSEGAWLSDNDIPNSFEFKGSVIFLTNLDFDATIAGGSKIGKHLEALVSRSHYVDLDIHTNLEKIIRIKQVVNNSDMLKGLSKGQIAEVIAFIEENLDDLREVSLRTALKVGTLCASGKPAWKKVAQITCCKK